MAKSRANENGCWKAIGIVVVVLIAVLSFVVHYSLGVEVHADENTADISTNRETLGRIDERLKGIETATERIEDLLRKARPSHTKRN